MKDWKIVTIRDITKSIESGVSVNGYDRIPKPHEKSVLKVSAVTYGAFNPLAAKPIKEKDLKRAKCQPKKDAILISRSNTPHLVGASAYVDKDYDNLFLPDLLWQLIKYPDAPVSMKWLAYFLSSTKSRKTISSFATGTSSSMYKIAKSNFLKMKVPLPNIDFQNQIISLLSKLDTLIQTTEQLLERKERMYAGWVSKVLFTNGYKKVKIKRFANEKSLRNKEEYERILSVTNKNGFVLPLDKFERRVASTNTSNYKIVLKGQYAYNPSRINVGSIARLDKWEKGVLSPMYVVFEVDKTCVLSDYFLHWLSSDEAKKRIKLAAQGSVRETVSFKDLGNISIPLPSLKEQEQITLTLNLLKREVGLYKNLVSLYKLQKQGLMQRLLNG